jgi:DNA polymerase III subunit chi
LVTQKGLQGTKKTPYPCFLSENSGQRDIEIEKMTDVRFYHLTRSSLDQTLPDLLEKTLSRGWRAVVLLKAEADVEPMATHLWTYRKESFLPHGAAKDGLAAEQPIWITHEDDRPNNAEVLFLIDGAVTEKAKEYNLICELFDGNDDGCVGIARARWVEYKKLGYHLTYWQQGEKGWTNKSE